MILGKFVYCDKLKGKLKRLGSSMIESVNSVVQSAPLTRADLQEVARQNNVRVQQEPPREIARAPFISPVIAVNVQYDTAVLEIRNASTGDVIDQIPSDPRLEAQLREQARQDTVQREAVSQEQTPVRTSQSGSDSAQASVQDVPATSGSSVSFEGSSGSVSTPAPVQQVAAFEAASRSGNSNAGSVSLFA